MIKEEIAMSIPFRISHFVLLITLLVSFTSYSQSINSSIKKMSEKADLIVEGKVVQKKSSWNKDKTRIYTDVTVQVDEYLKGNKGNNNIVITTPGGEVDGVGELYTHMPQFNNDEDVLVFVKEDKRDRSYKVFNGEDGKITLYKDKVTGEKVTPFNKKVSSLKKEINDYVNKKSQQ
jgi:hypothetical protein